RSWSVGQAAAVLDDVAQALTHIHEQGVLHLDLKPENILYAADGAVKITDFGLSVPSTDAEALAGGRAFQGTLDLILADVHLNGESGFGLLQAVKADPRLRSIPFLFLTSTADRETEWANALALGAARYLCRPIE